MYKDFISFLKRIVMRPLLVLFALFIIADIIFIKLTKDSFKVPQGEITVTGKVRDIDFDQGGAIKSVTIGNALCYVNQSDLVYDLHIGSIVSVTGVPHSFDYAMNLGGFDAAGYYKSINIDYSISNSVFKTVKRTHSIRDCFNTMLYRLSDITLAMCPFEAGTISTLLLGDKRRLPSDRKLIYSQAGVSHFLVISGLHVSAIGGFVYSLSKRIFQKRVPACIASVIVLTAYGLLVGFGISVIRSLVMYAVRLISYVLKRSYDQLSALSLAGIITILIYPYALPEMSFIYSYSTVAVISCFMIYGPKTKGQSVREKLSNLVYLPIVLAAYIMPVTLFFSGSYSLLSILYNLILMPLSLPIFVLAAMAIISGFLNLSIPAGIFDFLLHLILETFDNIFKFASSAGFFSLNGQPPLFFIVLYYLALTGVIIFCRYIGINRLSYKAVIFVSLVIFCFESFIPCRQITMLYVGQGECLLIKTGPHSAIISDCGSTSDKNLIKYTLIPYLKAAGITSVDSVLVSHPDKDHAGDIPALLNECPGYGIRVKEVIYPAFYDGNSTISDMENAAVNSKVILTGIEKGYEKRIKNLYIRCLSPDKKELKNDTNLDSLVFKISYPDCSILLTGDISAEIEHTLTSLPINSAILKIPHHGSNTASTEAFIKAVHPSVALISAGINNSYGHPHKEVLDRLTNLGISTYITSRFGEIDIIPAHGKLKIKKYIQ